MYDPAPARKTSAPTQAPLFVHQKGVGTPLLPIHGLLAADTMFDPVVPAWGAHHWVIVPDLRGHGRSGSLPGPYSVEQLAHDLAHLLDDLQVDVTDVLGYSQGGTVAQQFAHAYPARVRRLVLDCTFAHNALSRRERLEAMLAPWLVRILGVRRLACLAITSGGGRAMAPETAHWLQGILAADDTGRMVAAVAAAARLPIFRKISPSAPDVAEQTAMPSQRG